MAEWDPSIRCSMVEPDLGDPINKINLSCA
jgi:hypothetical protein